MILNIDKYPTTSIAAVDSCGEELSYGELSDFGCEIAQSLTRRSVVFLLVENDIGGIAWSIGLINSGLIPLLLNAQINKDLFKQLYDIYLPKYICAPDSSTLNNDGIKIIMRYGYSLLDVKNESYPVYENLSHLLPTSGSTGSPKLVRHSYDNIGASAQSVSKFFELSSQDRPLLVLPLYYTMGLSVVFSHLFVGATILITNLNMTQREFWAFLKDKKASSFTGVPYSYEVLKLMRFFRMDLPCLNLLTQGGGKLVNELNLQFAKYAKDNGKRWIATYGQTEGTARMAYLPAEYAISKCGSIGKAIPNGELLLVDYEENVINASYVEGEMCYRGDNVTLGYAIEREDLLKEDERHGFLRTGDLAYRDEDGFYYIVGRMGRFLKLYGMRIGLDECEQIIKAKYPIECACVGTDNKMIVYITECKYAKQVKEELVDKTKIVALAFDIKVIDRIPKNEAGKILYSKLDNVCKI